MRRLYFICIHTFVLLVGMHMLCSCQRDEDLFPTLPTEHEELVITVQSEKMLPKVVTTRVSDTKNEEETKINHLYVFFFDQDGNYLDDVVEEGNNGYQYTKFSAFVDTEETTIKIDKNAIKRVVDGDKPVQIYILANMEQYGLFEKDAKGRPILDGASNLQALQNKILQATDLQALQMDIPQGGMPMALLQEVNFGADDLGNNITVSLEALMARVDFNIKLASDYTGNGGLPMFYLDNYTVGNAPKGSLLNKTNTNPTIVASVGGKDDVEVRNQKLIYNKNGEIAFTFYMFENLQTKKEPDSSSGVGYKETQHYKPMIAPDTATYVDLNGIYTTYDNHDYNITYRLYLGANHTDNFEVKRNHQYKNDITIKGLTKYKDITGGDYFTLDTRVKIHESSKFYISILNEKALDAHFCVLPMDIYFLGQTNNAKIVVTLGDDVESCWYENSSGVMTEYSEPWIRMEKIPAAHMNAGTLPDGYGSSHVATGNFKAYHGIRKYFTEDLVTNTLKESGKSLVVDTSRDRIYLYIDENLGDNERTGTVILKYYENGNTSGTPDRTETVTIRQLPLVKVNLREIYPNDNMPSAAEIIWMEQIEEYLDSYDPLEEYENNNKFEGLPWGFGTEAIPRIKACNSYQQYHYGLEASSLIMAMLASKYQYDMNSLYLNNIPKCAIQYCFNRNKRQANGEVQSLSCSQKTNIIPYYKYYEISNLSAKWFLPGVRQMEGSLTTYYSVFPEFQGNFYWSSSSGINGSSEAKQYARATKVKDNAQNLTAQNLYESSNLNDNGPGAKVRTDTSVRIRAFRIDRKKR